MKKRNKKGASHHLEMIIAFVLFAAIVTFLLLYIRPYEKPVLADTILFGLENSFKEEVYTDLTKISLKPESSSSCMSLDLSSLSLDINGGILLMDDGGGSVDGGLSGNNLIVSSGGDFFYLLISPEFSSFGNPCSNAEVVEFDAGGIVEKQLISNQKVLDVKSRYESDYNGLQQDLGVPTTADFAILIDGVSMEKNVPEEVEVRARTFYEDVLSSDGGIENKEIVLKIW